MRIVYVAIFLFVVNLSLAMVAVSGAFDCDTTKTIVGDAIASGSEKCSYITGTGTNPEYEGTAMQTMTAMVKTPPPLSALDQLGAVISGAIMGIIWFAGIVINAPTAMGHLVGLAVPGTNVVEGYLVNAIQGGLWAIYILAIVSIISQTRFED